MSQTAIIRAEDIESLLKWNDVIEAMTEGHNLDRADINEFQFRHDQDVLLNRAAWIRGLGMGVKIATIFPGNPKRKVPVPTVHSVFVLFDGESGEPVALIDGAMLTKWKTAGDSVLAAKLLARPDSKRLLIVGAGTVARSLIEAYREVFPDLEDISIWNRTYNKAQELAKAVSNENQRVSAVKDLAASVATADIVSSATMSCEPILRGEWVQPGTHVDLIGAFRPDMREADDALLMKSEIFVDARETAVHHIGELAIPIKNGVITQDHIRGDFYDLLAGHQACRDKKAITVFKNGGGAHLDLMTGHMMYKKYLAAT